MNTHTTESLSALDIKELRQVFMQATGKGPGVRKPETLIQGILDAQDEATTSDQQESEDDDAEPEGSDASQDESAPDEPAKVRVVGTGSLQGSTLLCDIISHSGTVATVKVFEQGVRFRADDGLPCRSRKTWKGGGWKLEVNSLPEMAEPTPAELAEMPTRDLSVAQLQVVYEHFSGRTSDSTSRIYLANRIRLAREGKLPTGSRRSRNGEPCKVIPVGLPASTVKRVDEIWRKHDYSSRNAFIRAAMGEKLEALGESEVAALL